MDKIREQNNTRLTNLKHFTTFLEDGKNAVQDTFDEVYTRKLKVTDREEKLKYNFEVVVYLKQGQVEVPQLPVATDYKDAILLNRNVINQENSEIRHRGNEKVKQMEKILQHKTTLKSVQYENKKLKLQIVDFEKRAQDVQLYRVTKQT